MIRLNTLAWMLLPALLPMTSGGCENRSLLDVVAGTNPQDQEIDSSFKVDSHWAHSRMVVYLLGQDKVLMVVWNLPAQLRQPVREEIRATPAAPGETIPVVRLYRGSDIADDFPEDRQPRPPRFYQDATEGTLLCEPSGSRRARITLRNIRAGTFAADELGPFEVDLDRPAPTQPASPG